MCALGCASATCRAEQHCDLAPRPCLESEQHRQHATIIKAMKHLPLLRPAPTLNPAMPVCANRDRSLFICTRIYHHRLY